ncbi:efflux RND transporter permease subunit [Persicimonas caeni]|uniref:Efflux RND transporter permease subunit n=1 Tax=Persicimonas caeni TaxID=2292766 RepID=A0A4Y6PPS6_PERCE|nr:CusA/CzcA family heavy metal efflux RND transporter [Persicimonas caeni]QDG49765.1 efflux RND transporter permease subunit [Persicimonas caeni]QED30986.1 efflux RND transporter permease subunit [Persicimonas caeni]
MWLLEKTIEKSVQHRMFVLIGVLAFAALGIFSLRFVTFDAFPDLTNVQVQVVTASPGMASEETELLVTLPIERELSGVPGVTELRSLSRTGISSIAVVFEDGTDLWHARQLVKERLDGARDAIPEAAGQPELGPPATGLGEVFQFTVSSDRHTKYELDRIFKRDIQPRLLAVDGIVEVNAWGGGEPQLHVRLDPYKLAAHDVSVGEVQAAIRSSLGLTAGGAIIGGPEQVLVRALANPATPDELGAIAVPTEDDEVYLRDIATIEDAGALTVGLGSADAEGEALFAVAQLLSGADALSVVDEIRERIEEVEQILPEGVEIGVVYDRKKLVGNTLSTVTKSLIEGGVLVILVLLLMLGDIRAGLLVASVIPLSMLGAFLGLNALGYTGNLMSLGAIDFGLIVDGTIVVVESIVALHLGKQLTEKQRRQAMVEQAQTVAGPVLFAVGILILVYIPILTMWGVEGKLFRPMALTVLLALSTALVLSYTYVPAASSLIIEPKGEHKTWLADKLSRLYEPVLDHAMSKPLVPVLAAVGAFGASAVLAINMGIEFVPQLQEGDIVVQTARVPSISPDKALEEATRIEKIIGEFPEVERVASRTGAPGLATDPMGLEESDILVKLAPRDEWVTAQTQQGLVNAISKRLETEAPGAALTFTQPIEMRFNEMLEGITSDVGVKVFGPDLDTLIDISEQIAATLEEVPGAADVTPPAIEGVPNLEVDLDAAKLARYGLVAEDVMDVVAGIQRGTSVGTVRRGQFRDAIVVKLDYRNDFPLTDLPITLPQGGSIPLGEVADVREVTSPAIIEREANSRRFIVQANVRGRDLGGFVQEAQEKVGALDLPDGYWVEWSGKYEQLRAAASRTAVSVPIVLFLILGVLYVAFRSWRIALLIFLNVPVAASGGIIILWLRDLPISMSAIVGLIALFGIAVMNGIVLLSRTRELHKETGDAHQAAHKSAEERFRPVLMTAFVAGIGFLPMALQTGVGAEVQRPLATVVIGGLVTSTLLTLVVVPTLYARLIKRSGREQQTE